MRAMSRGNRLPDPRHDLRFDAAIGRWDEALPLGNGRTGCLVWGDGHPLALSLDRSDLWDLRPQPEWSAPDCTYATLIELVQAGNRDEIIRRFEAPFNKRATPTKIKAGRLEINFGRPARKVSSRLSLADGTASVRLAFAEGKADVRTFVHAAQPLGFIRIKSPATLPQIRLLSHCTEVAPALQDAGDERLGQIGCDALGYPAAEHGRGGSLFWCRQKTYDGNEFAILVAEKRTEGSVLLVYTLARSDDGPAWFEEAGQQVRAALRNGFGRAHATHKKWWKAFWARSAVRLPEKEAERQWYLNNYLFGSCSRKGAPPMPLQGVWTAEEEAIPPWKGNYTNDTNTQMSYWHYAVANHLEEGESLVDFLWGLRDKACAFARTFYDAPGICLPGCMTIEGEPMGGWAMYSLSITSHAWLCQAFDDYWRATGDTDFLREKAYPYLKDSADCLLRWLAPGPDGKLRLPVSSSPEYDGNELTSWLTPNSNHDLAILIWLFRTLVRMAEALGNGEADRWQETLARLPELSVNPDDVLMISPDRSPTYSHHHASHAMAIYPLKILDRYASEGDRKIIDGTVGNLEAIGTQGWIGFSFPWMAVLCARQGNGERAAHYLKLFRDCFCSPNGFDLNGDYKQQGVSAATYRPFTLEGNMGAAAALQEMLLQADTGILRVFPAVPQAWREQGLSFTRLRAEGGVLVSAAIAGGRLESMTLEADRDTECVVENGFDYDQLLLSGAGSEMRLSCPQGGTFVVDLQRGQALQLAIDPLRGSAAEDVHCQLQGLTPSPFLKNDGGGLVQLVRVHIVNPGAPCAATLIAIGPAQAREQPIEPLPGGESVHEAWIEEVKDRRPVTFVLRVGDREADRRTVEWDPPRHWRVHVVQLSHHDVGYTDLASRVLCEHDRFLASVVDRAHATRDFPEEAQFRITVEQAWSIDHFFRHADPNRAAQMAELMRSGHVDLTALFGNMTTELCGPETLARCLYPTFRLKREYGIPIVSAEHNDVPGFTWGLAEVLTGAGIEIFCPGLPRYYDWGGQGFPSFWDEQAIFGRTRIPGAFWWESPSGRRILFWSGNRGCGGDCRPSLPKLAETLSEFSRKGYLFSVIRWAVQGGARDNSPYIAGYTETIRTWNETWAWPKLISSTNRMFWEDLKREALEDLPVLRGDLPGQDYCPGAMSTAADTAANRENHTASVAAEAAAVAGSVLSDLVYPVDAIADAFEESLWHDEHTWGHHFPCGPAAEAARREKGVHAWRGLALSRDVAAKAMARIADHIRFDDEGPHLVVFNPLPHERTDRVRTPLREMENCSTCMTRITPERNPEDHGWLRGVALTDRWHTVLPQELTEGRFDLVDMTTGEPVPFDVLDIHSPFDGTPHAPERVGLAAGGKRYGFMDDPGGLGKDLCFLARGVPALGYKAYRFAPRKTKQRPAPLPVPGVTSIQNEYYRLEVDADTGLLASLQDKETGREWVDTAAPYGFGAMLVRRPGAKPEACRLLDRPPQRAGAESVSLRILHIGPAHPRIEQVWTLHAGIKRVEVAVSVLKDPTPLLELMMTFPFALPAGRFTYEGPFCCVRPGEDFLPGAYGNRLTVQNWVRAADDESAVVWTSLDSPSVSLGRLTADRVSQAHRSVVADEELRDPPPGGDFRGGWIHSVIAANNFGTNFYPSQSGLLLARYAFTTGADDLTRGACAAFGASVMNPLQTILTEGRGAGALPVQQGFLALDNSAVRMTAFKKAEDGRGLILRLWNPEPREQDVGVSLPRLALERVVRCTLVEEDMDEERDRDECGFRVSLEGGAVMTLRLLAGA